MKVLRCYSGIPIALFVLFLNFPNIGYGGTLTGTVIDNAYFNPVSDVAVSAYHSDSTPAGVDTTGVDGTYALILDAGEYFAVYSKTSYADTTVTDISITLEGTTIVDLTFRFVPNCDYVVGDVNGSGWLNGLDVTFGIAYFKGGPTPFGCLCECTPGHSWYVCGDANGSCVYNGVDITYLIAIYQGGPWIIPCPDCPPAVLGDGGVK
jgi:hypothetical protein